MNWTNILEGVIGSLIAFLISTITVFLFHKFFAKKNKDKTPDEKTTFNFNSFFKNPFLLSLFITSFLFIITFFSFVFSWSVEYSTYLSVASFILLIITYLIYENQCPNCKKIFHKKLINKKTLKEEKRPYRYRDETIYLYSDGSEKDRKFTGPLKTIMETIRTEKEYYKCTSCGHEWDKIFERNLDEANRPKPNVVRTKIKPPHEY